MPMGKNWSLTQWICIILDWVSFQFPSQKPSMETKEMANNKQLRDINRKWWTHILQEKEVVLVWKSATWESFFWYLIGSALKLYFTWEKLELLSPALPPSFLLQSDYRTSWDTGGKIIPWRHQLSKSFWLSINAYHAYQWKPCKNATHQISY